MEAITISTQDEKKGPLPWALLSFSRENANADFNYFNLLSRFDSTEMYCQQGLKRSGAQITSEAMP